MWIETTVRAEPGSDEICRTKLPMYDPHELLAYLCHTGKICVSDAAIEHLGC